MRPGIGSGRIDTVAGELATGGAVDWSVCVRDVATGRAVGGLAPRRVLPIASVGKLLLLVEVARQAAAGELSLRTRLRRTAHLAVADSGLWRHLDAEEMTVGDLAALVGAVSDNLATNVLLEHVGLARVRDLTDSLDVGGVALLDRVRDHRGDEHPRTLAKGSAGPLTDLLARLARGEVISREVSERVLGWLALGVDLSMVAAGLGLDPLSHADGDRGLWLRNKTGTDPGVRAEAGILWRGDASLAYAVIARWDPVDDARRDEVLAGMSALGAAVHGRLLDRAREVC